jgi:protein-tyrosine phosphatase
MAEYLARARLPDERAHFVASAGIAAWEGAPAQPGAVAVMAERGIDLRDHRGRRFDLAFARDFDLILVMESGQQQWIHRQFPILRGRVRRLGEPLSQDIPDPLGQPVVQFRRVRDVIERALTPWLECARA